MRRYAILVSFSVFLVGPVLGTIISLGKLSSNSPTTGIFLMSLMAFPVMLIACAMGTEKHPKLVRGVLLAVFFVFLALLPFLALPTIT